MKRNKKGFTLIELSLVIAILGILAIAALPKFINLSQEAEEASMEGVVGAVRAGIALYRANDMVTSGGTGNYPTTLDAVGATTDCGSAALCFTTVLSTGVDDSSWHKVSNTQYTFDDGATVTTYNYDSTAGTFNP
jgi:MSHA pilin protein MshB